VFRFLAKPATAFGVLLVGVTVASTARFTTFGYWPTILEWTLMVALYAAGLLATVRSREIRRWRSDRVIVAYLLWVLISAVRGAWVAEIYWDYKFLIEGSGAVLLPVLTWAFANPQFVGRVLGLWIKLALPIFALLFVFMDPKGYGHYLAPLVIFMLFLPAMGAIPKTFTLAGTLVVLVSSLANRSNFLRFAVALVLSGLFPLRQVVGKQLLTWTAVVVFALPPLLLYLGASGTFNVFRFDDYVRPGSFGLQGESYELATSDTRTFIYQEVWRSAKKYDHVWAGRSLARGYESEHFGRRMDRAHDMDRGERYASEVGIMNVFNWMGVIGVLLYTAIFVTASWLAIRRSRSFFIKLVGLYVAFRWAYSWVEEFTTFGIPYLTLWILVAIAYSPDFRAMTDQQFRAWVEGVLSAGRRREAPR
jgi:hypothetical protein